MEKNKKTEEIKENTAAETDAFEAEEDRNLTIDDIENAPDDPEELFSELGMNLSTAFNIFVRQSLREGGIPFEIRMEQPNKETMAAMLEAERIAKDPTVKHYSDVEEALRELKR